MNKTKIEWTNYTWNPVTGCKHGCWYCYAKRLAEGKLRHLYPQGFEPTFWPERLAEPARVKEPSKIFVCSMADLFGEWVPGGWIEAVMEVARANPQHTFQFLTKNPGRYYRRRFPDNAWAGMSFTRPWGCADMQDIDVGVRFLSIEPLMAEPRLFKMRGVHWVIIGAMTGPGAVKPKPEWVRVIVTEADRANVPVFLKHNLGKLRDEFDYRQEWPR